MLREYGLELVKSDINKDTEEVMVNEKREKVTEEILESMGGAPAASGGKPKKDKKDEAKVEVPDEEFPKAEKADFDQAIET